MEIGKLYEFIGQDGSLGLKKGNFYKVILIRQLFGINTIISIPVGLFHRRYIHCPYSSMKTFEQNWKKV